MKKSFVIFVAAINLGCGPMLNEEIVKQKDLCEAHGMKAETVRNLDRIVKAIQCVPVSEGR